MLRHFRLAALAAVGGALTGLISFAFLESLEWATRTRLSNGWLLWLLPVVGVAVGAVYHYFGGRAKGGTPAVIEQGHLFTHGVPARMAPLVFGGTVASHLAGASVGREGTALQMAGSVTDSAARLARLSAIDRRTLIAASLAGGWGAVFAVPITGIVFMLQVTRRHSLSALLPAVVAAFTGHFVVVELGHDVSHRPQLPSAEWTIGLPFKLVAAGLVFGLLARTFVWALHLAKAKVAAWVSWPPARPLLGAVATIALVGLVGRDYLGLSTQLLDPTFSGSTTDWWVPLLKLLFTLIALGTGFIGGEVTPLFVMGGTMGSVLAPGLDAPSVLLATTGSAAVFSSAAGIAATGVVLTVEQFGWHSLLPAVLVCVAARVAAGRPGLYVTHT